MSEDDYLDPEGEDDGCRQLLQVSGEEVDVRAFRKELEETERWGTELDHFLKFGEFDAVPEHLFDDSARTMGRLCAFLRERWGNPSSPHRLGHDARQAVERALALDPGNRRARELQKILRVLR